MNKIKVGDTIRNQTLTTITSDTIQIPDPGSIVHLQFRRFAGCPFCTMHLNSFAREYNKIRAAGIQEIVVFKSTDEALRRHHPDLPFSVLADPEATLYNEFGVESHLKSVLNPHVLLVALPRITGMLPKFPGMPASSSGALGLPADFLIANDGRVLACKYGNHADDQWSVNELLTLLKPETQTTT